MKKVTTVVLAALLAVGISALAFMANMGDKAFATGTVTDGEAVISLISVPAGSAELLPGAQAEKSFKIKNEGAESFVWLTYAVPNGLDGANGALTISASFDDTKWEKKAEPSIETIKGKQYTVYTLLYKDALGQNNETSKVELTAVMAANIDIDENGNWIRVVNGEVTDLKWNSEAAAPAVYVTAWAGIKASTVDSVEAAYTVAENLNNTAENTQE